MQPSSDMIENSIYTSILPVAYSGYINRGKACSDPLKIRSYKWSVEEMKVEEDEEWEGDELRLVNWIPIRDDIGEHLQDIIGV